LGDRCPPTANNISYRTPAGSQVGGPIFERFMQGRKQ
jgi:hypothetical protein